MNLHAFMNGDIEKGPEGFPMFIFLLSHRSPHPSPKRTEKTKHHVKTAPSKKTLAKFTTKAKNISAALFGGG